MIGDVAVRVSSDLQLSFPRDRSFVLNGAERSDPGGPQVTITLDELADSGEAEPALSTDEVAWLVSAGGWPERWFRSRAARFPQVVGALRGCLAAPERCDIEFAWDRAIVCNYAERWARVFYPAARRQGVSEGRFLAGFRNLVGRFLSLFDLALIHGAGAVFDGRVALFLAPDGGGKTTLVKSIPEKAILSDDHVAVRPDTPGRTLVHSTPFGTMSCGPRSAPLGAIFLLRKAATPSVRPASLATALPSLLDGQQMNWLATPAPMRRRAFNLVVDSCRDVPLFELDVPKPFEGWDLIFKHMSRRPGV
ncbi:MAG: hypothetical protein AB2L07_12325 [Thermoanaerobaculaceae bacterium]